MALLQYDGINSRGYYGKNIMERNVEIMGIYSVQYSSDLLAAAKSAGAVRYKIDYFDSLTAPQ
jgi:hypothetical protein